MSESDIAVNTLNSTLQRHAKVVHGYEVEIANMTAEIYRLKKEIEDLKKDDPDDLFIHDKIE